jgi:hypothetical protein
MGEVPARFVELINTVTSSIAGRALDADLEADLQARYPPGSSLFDELQSLCRQGRNQGWLCTREMGGLRFGRAVKPGPGTHSFSVDVVEMNDIVGPEHRHPNGEIDLIMPDDESESAMFDGAPRGWKVYAPDTVHSPTVTGGRALILYLLPEGSIQFTAA